jgi:hypothetical protein
VGQRNDAGSGLGRSREISVGQTKRLMAQNLHRVRELIGADLVRQVDKITRDMGEQTPTITGATLPGDGRRLRGIPVVSKGVQGAMFGTRPDREIDKLDAA